ncbi:MAG: integrase arm-type DNA-binding domain-containing protein [Gammaproteobacteria bacterium]|nr:integrase arm-type DNA-binding domain-containing protein [Gammaproteobacteria bacterium]
MANKLTDAQCRNLQHSGRTRSEEQRGDGGGLYLRVHPGGSKHWIQRMTIYGKRRTLGLGGYPVVTLAEARKQALENRRIVWRGGDPRALRRKRSTPDFAAAAEKVIRLREPAWKNGGGSAAIWRASLETYAYPVIGAMPVDKIATADVLEAVEPIWAKKRETAMRLRQRISIIMRWCVAKGYIAHDPAGTAVLEALPKGTGQAKRHFAALPYAEAPGALAKIRRSNAWIGTKLAFEFLILTAARSGEVRLMTWKEIDLFERMWTVPAHRMKAKIEHRVPLADAALAALKQARSISEEPMTAQHAGCAWVFPNVSGQAMSNSTKSKLCRELGIQAVPHGFRSSFRDWAAEQTDTSHAVMEAALAHTIPNAAERAYARSDLLEKRRKLMDHWSMFVTGEMP